jgi:hypothetical protein
MLLLPAPPSSPQVKDWVFMHTLQDLPSSTPPTTTSSSSAGALSLPTPGADSKYLLLVSGLHIGNPAPAQGTAARCVGAACTAG